MIKIQGSSKCFDNKHLRVSWKMCNFCNFKCSYCFDRNKSLSAFPTKNNIDMLIKNILKLKYNTYEFVILGGEPLYYPYIQYLIKKLSSVNSVIRIVIVTNGSNIEKIRDISNIDASKIHFSFSIHPESYTEEMLVNLLNETSKYNNNFYFSLMYLPKYRRKLIDFYNIILSYKYKSEFMIIRKGPDFTELIDYTDSDIAFLTEHFDDVQFIDGYDSIWQTENSKFTYENHGFLMINKEKYLKFKDYYCLSNTTSMSVDDKGYFRGLICDEAKKSKFSLYNKIKEENFLIPNIIKCKKDHCLCMGNRHVLKFKDLDECKAMLEKW